MRGSPGIVEVDKWTGKIWLKMLDKAISESYENQNSLPINDPDIDALDRDVKSGLIGSEELTHKGKLVLGLKRGEIRLDELSPEDLALVGKTPKDVELFKKQGWVEVK